MDMLRLRLCSLQRLNTIKVKLALQLYDSVMSMPIIKHLDIVFTILCQLIL